MSVLRWHALSGYSLELTQFTVGRATIVGGTRALLDSIGSVTPFERRLDTAVAAVTQRGNRVEVETRGGDTFAAGAAVVAVPLNAVGAIEFTPALPEDKRRAIALGQASRGIKIFIRARGEPLLQNSIRPGHPFGHLDTDWVDGDGVQQLIGFGIDAERCHAGDLPALQSQLEAILPGYVVVDATAHDWLADELSRGTWAIHRPRLVRAPPRRDATGRGAGCAGRLGHRQRVGRLHRRRDRVGAAPGARASALTG